MSNSISQGIVYLLTNPSMPGLVKIGKTTRGSTENRMVELYTTGVPVPFVCEYAGLVENVSAVELAFHTAFEPQRINAKREFFQIEPEQAIVLLRLLSKEDLTPEMMKESDQIDTVSKESTEKLIKRRPRFNFSEMGIPVGSKLISTKTDEIAEVLNEKSVKFRNEEISLTKATQIILGNDYQVAPGPYWKFNGKTVREIYNETYQKDV